jgi:hypothetical protein
MSQIAQDIEEIELTIEHARHLVEKAEMADRLSRNPDFRKLIMEGYFETETARLGLLVGDPHHADSQEMIMNDLKGTGALKRFFQNIFLLGRTAAAEIESSGYTLQELRDEEDGSVTTGGDDFEGDDS